MEDLKAKIIEDRKNGLKYREIMQKYNLRSNYEIKKALGKELGKFDNYIRITISKEKIKKLSNCDISSIVAYLEQDCFDAINCEGLLNLKIELRKELRRRK